jgi:hypothetical protein
MSTPSRPSLLRRLIGLPPRPVADDDAGDMGTAMGLDFTLDQAPLKPEPPRTTRPRVASWPRRRQS